jgi:outer membrane protein TolC
MKARITFIILSLAWYAGWTQNSNPILEKYIQAGLENNLVLQQKASSYEKSLEALNEARAYFLPAISFNARYSIASGGRKIEFPVGDLLNPVYSTLNALTGSTEFPQLENQEFEFLRPEEQETKLELIQPIFNPSIAYNYKISKQVSYAQKATLDAYRRQLVADIKTAYFSYLKTLKLQELVEETRRLLEENIRVNQSLYQNDKVTIDVVYRSEAELSKLEQNEAIVLKDKQMAASWFNFLLNRSFDAPIEVQQEVTLTRGKEPLPNAQTMALSNREELQQLEFFQRAAEYELRLNQSNAVPKLFAAVNYGIQGVRYSFTPEDDFFLGSLVLRWDLFKGFENRSRIRQSRIRLDELDAKKAEVTDRIQLEVNDAYYNLLAASKYVDAVLKEKVSSEKAFKVVQRKYSEGMVTLVEFIDSRTTMTTATANYIISQFEYRIMEAEYERVVGGFELPPVQP